MAGLFQIFGFSFLFWLLMGILRFVFETLHAMREVPHRYTLFNLLIASLGGVCVGVSLFFVFFFSFGPVESTLSANAFPTFALSILIIWLASVAFGSYLASRIYIQRPYFIAALVGGGTILTGAILLYLAQIGFAFTRPAMEWAGVWTTVTFLASFLGAHISRALNALERERSMEKQKTLRSARIKPEDVAILIAAHNEELTIESTIESVLQFAQTKHIYVASDGSSDKTVEICKRLSVGVEDIQPNRGKARALTYMIEKHKLLDNYKAVMIMDADLKVAKDYFEQMLPAFDDPTTAAAVSRAVPHWPPHAIPRWNMLITAYRVQLWRILQFCIRYGQTWRYMNVTPIIPGGSSIYRTSVLRKIEIDVPDLIIEDFNMTFEVHHKNLGKIAYCWNAILIDQEPYSVRDFIKQIYRWYLGFWQTARRHGVWFSFFWATMALFAFELMLSSIVFLLFPFYALLALLVYFVPTLPFAWLVAGHELTVFSVFVSLFALEYVITIFLAVLEKRPLMLVYGLLFFPLRYIESLVFFCTIPRAFFGKYNGQWKSPKRIAYSEKKAA